VREGSCAEIEVVVMRRRSTWLVAIVAVAGLLAAACGADGAPAAPQAPEQADPDTTAVADTTPADPPDQTDQAAQSQASSPPDEQQVDQPPPPQQSDEQTKPDPAPADDAETSDSFDSPALTPPPLGESDLLRPQFLFLPPDATLTPSGAPILRGPTDAPVGRPWQTNWDVRLAPPEEFIAVLPRDAILSLDAPRYDDIATAGIWLTAGHPVIQIEINGDARAFPLGIMSKHEIVNTEIGGLAVAVTFCPLCNSAIAFQRILEGEIVTFGVSGMLRNSDLVMWDRTTQTLWQQLTGEALVGAMVGMKLDLLSAPIVSWAQFRTAFPNGLVLSQNTGFLARYDLNSYVGYDSAGPYAQFFSDETDPRLLANARVAAVDLNDQRVAYAFDLLAHERVLHDTVGGQEIVIVWTPGAVSALDRNSIADSANVGASGVFLRSLDDRLLTFAPNPDDPATFLDTETNSVWDIFGRAVAGELQGSQLQAVVHGNHFWFAWAAFFPDTELVRLDA